MNETSSGPTPAQLTGSDGSFFWLVQVMSQHFVAAAGLDPQKPENMNSPEAKRIREILLSLYPEFERRYTEVFVKHVGAEHAPEVLAELSREPLRRYVQARLAMSLELSAGLNQLTQRMGETEL